VIEHVGFIVAAYVVVWGGVTAYAVSLARRRDRS
jgi:CcmD family protein